MKPTSARPKSNGGIARQAGEYGDVDCDVQKDLAFDRIHMATLPTRELLTLHELVERSGYSASTIHRLKAKGQIPFFQPAGKGGKILFPPDAIQRGDRALDAYQPPTEAPPKPKALSGPPPKWMRT